MIESIGATAQVHAQSCGSGNHHGSGDDTSKTNSNGNSVGNPYNSDEGQTNGNPHCEDMF